MKNKYIHVAKTQTLNINAAQAELSKLQERAAAAFEEASYLQSRANTLNACLLKLLKELNEAEQVGEELETQLAELEKDGCAEQALASMKNVLANLGITLRMGNQVENRQLYKFHFGENRCVTTEHDPGRFWLVQISPPHANFADIKAFADKTQDLSGLLINLGEYFKANERK